MEGIVAQLKSLDESQKGVEKAVGKLVDAGQSKSLLNSFLRNQSSNIIVQFNYKRRSSNGLAHQRRMSMMIYASNAMHPQQSGY
jgi:hypothetical protein